ncbi:hypothetical protein DM826_05160 [Halonotius aquaticus]|uniref:Uncharacterized protein n=1 Tax=Halonotius aquaticus TaxID=2216978 RepID=A0A3A6PSZ2_9EURY|nr:hypothetical protein [Halonotius aquaticus]RJX43641.1 hypothetical protein DM826_05160 [Halonotius aquaticus]
MSNNRSAVGHLGGGDAPPCKQPLEVIETEQGYVCREFRRTPEEATIFSVHRRRMEAMAAASDRLEADRHPCTLRWDSATSVGDVYWNDLFSTLRVTYSQLLKKWLVVPEGERYVFGSASAVKQAYEYGKQAQEQFDFKELAVHARDGSIEKTVEHPFLRESITDANVKFNR